jgi:erythromycin esterase-like protein
MRAVEPGEADPIAVLRRMLSAEHKLTGTDSSTLVRWLKQQIGERESNMRARFAGYPDERIYKDAIAAMRAAVNESRPVERRQALAQAHDKLVALAEAAPLSTCGLATPDRGLWSAIDFEPFFFLAVIDAMSNSELRR